MNRAQRPRRRWPAEYLVLLLLIVPALYPLTRAGIVATHDGLQQIYRFYDLDYAWRGGALFPRWLPNQHFGYGNPMVNYYSTFAYYLALPILALSGRFLFTLEAMFGISLLLGAFGMFLLGRRFLGRAGALAAALLYTYLPYHLADVYVRGTLGESLAFALLPWIVLALRAVIERPHAGNLAGLGIGLALLVLTHNLSALMAAPVLVACAVMEMQRRHAWRVLPRLLGSVLLGAGLSAYYWLPMLAEAGFTRSATIVGMSDLVTRRLAPLTEMLSPYWLYRYYPHQGTAFDHPFSPLSLVLLALALLGLLIAWRRLSSQARGWSLLCACSFALGVFLMTPASRQLWGDVGPLRYLQFPWRWHLITSLGLAGLVGAGVAAWKALLPSPDALRRLWPLFPALLTTLLAVSALWYLPPDPLLYPEEPRPLAEEDMNLEGMAAYEHQLFLAGREWKDPWIFESLPKWVSARPDDFILPAGPAAASASRPPTIQNLEVLEQGPLHLRLRVQAGDRTTLRLHTFYFPGWRGWIDGVPVNIYPSTPLGLSSVDVPAGEHELRIAFGSTPPRRIGEILTLFSLLAVLAGLLVARRPRLVCALVLALALLAGAWAWRGQESTILHPTQTWFNFADSYALTASEVRQAGAGSLEVRLWWLSLVQPVENDKMFVHIEDAHGRRWVQEDHQPVFNASPTTRWAENELVWDLFRFSLPADMPAGDYRLYAGIYHSSNLQNLEILDAMGNPQGQRALIGTFALER